MARREPMQFWFLVRRDKLEQLGVADALDLLRYDAAVPKSNPPEGFYLFTCDHLPTVDRWSSFGTPIVYWEHYRGEMRGGIHEAAKRLRDWDDAGLGDPKGGAFGMRGPRGGGS